MASNVAFTPGSVMNVEQTFAFTLGFVHVMCIHTSFASGLIPDKKILLHASFESVINLDNNPHHRLIKRLGLYARHSNKIIR